MGKFTDWIKEHVRPYAKINDDQGDFSVIQNDDKPASPQEFIKDELKKTEVGIKITWKW